MGRKRLYVLSSRHPIYSAWYNMKKRCSDPTRHNANSYIGKDITISSEWMQYINFEQDMLDTWRPGLTLDRRNNNLGYFKENCRWVSPRENVHNSSLVKLSPEQVKYIREQRKHRGVTLSVLAKELSVSISVISRADRGDTYGLPT